jgi:hypothetical protein
MKRMITTKMMEAATVMCTSAPEPVEGRDETSMMADPKDS